MCEEGVGGVVRNVTWCVCVCVCVSERANTTSTACEEGRVEVRAHTHTTSTARPRGQEREGRAARALCARLAAVWGGGRKAWKFELHVCTARRRGASSPCHVHDCGTGDVLRESANVDLARGPYGSAVCVGPAEPAAEPDADSDAESEAEPDVEPDAEGRVFVERCAEHDVVAGWAAVREWSSAQASC